MEIKCNYCGSKNVESEMSSFINKNIESEMSRFIDQNGCGCNFASSRLDGYICKDCNKTFDACNQLPKINLDYKPNCLWGNPQCLRERK